MKNVVLSLLVFFISVANAYSQNQFINIKTELGNIELELYPEKAPITVRNFLEYVKRGLFTDASFYRTVTMQNQPNNDIKIEVIQGGLQFKEGIESLPGITHETTEQTGILHKNGAISMARSRPGSATAEFFICINDQPSLDFGGMRNSDGQGFAAFGIVTKGMDIVHKIHNQKEEGQMMNPRIRIESIELIAR